MMPVCPSFPNSLPPGPRRLFLHPALRRHHVSHASTFTTCWTRAMSENVDDCMMEFTPDVATYVALATSDGASAAPLPAAFSAPSAPSVTAHPHARLPSPWPHPHHPPSLISPSNKCPLS
jgi:hypothetical protein